MPNIPPITVPFLDKNTLRVNTIWWGFFLKVITKLSFRAALTTNQTILAADGIVPLLMTQQVSEVGGDWYDAPNHQATIKNGEAGDYLITLATYQTIVAAGDNIDLFVYVNGVNVLFSSRIAAFAGGQSATPISTSLYLNDGDVVDPRFRIVNNNTVVLAYNSHTYFTMVKQ